jgi:hypothetical protein
MDFSNRDLFIALLSAVTSGGFFTGLSILLKWRAEKGKLLVDSASSVVVMQRDVIKDLEDRIQELGAENLVLRKRIKLMEQHLFDIDEKVESLTNGKK